MKKNRKGICETTPEGEVKLMSEREGELVEVSKEDFIADVLEKCGLQPGD